MDGPTTETFLYCSQETLDVSWLWLKWKESPDNILAPCRLPHIFQIPPPFSFLPWLFQNFIILLLFSYLTFSKQQCFLQRDNKYFGKNNFLWFYFQETNKNNDKILTFPPVSPVFSFLCSWPRSPSILALV